MWSINYCRSLHSMHVDGRFAVAFQKHVEIRCCAVPSRHHIKWPALVTDYGHSFVVIGEKNFEPLGSGIGREQRWQLRHDGKILFEICNLFDRSHVPELD